jgi:hypothetical protein
MKASELRIGNLINSLGWDENSNGDIVADPDGDEIIKVDLQILSYIENPKGHITKHDFIPLTEEWLFEFGFQKIGSEWVKQGDFAISLFHDGYHYTGLEGVQFGIAFNSVHHLQNLYFALTGQELTIKESFSELEKKYRNGC